MLIRGVNFPQALIEAHQSGSLVLFVGAGASMDEPSALPSFVRLAADIAADASVEVTREEGDQPDLLLGELKDEHGVDVHLRVAKRIGVESSRPNALHEGLVDLALAAPKARIITTNYDLHLSSVAADRGVELDHFAGPALPMGDDFTGIVYLHGCLTQPSHRLVVTDEDFGRAYLRDAWAARFLERMFATYSVLFIGYSHNDVVMTYLGRALGSRSQRYALTDSPRAPHWRRLRIEPIGYEVDGGSHNAAIDAVRGWGAWAAMGLLDHHRRIGELVANPPSHVPEEASYLEAALTDPARAQAFVEQARGEEWLAWVAGRPEFAILLDPGAEHGEVAWLLANWFANHYVLNEEFTQAALEVVRAAGARLSRTLWVAIAGALHQKDGRRAAWVGPWLVLLLQNVAEHSVDLLDYALRKSWWPDDRASLLLLLDYLTEPQAVPQPNFGLTSGVRFDIELRGSAHWLEETWQQVLRPQLATAADDVVPIVERHLRRAYQLLVTSGSANEAWDPVSFRRSAIEPHPQDDMRNAIDVVIDAARDCLEHVLAERPAAAMFLLGAWASSDVPMLRRLAIHGWAIRGDVDGTAKLAWLLDRGWLFDHQLRHETFRLIEIALPKASEEISASLVRAVLTGPEAASDEEHRDYQQFNALVWINKHAPTLASALDALDALRKKHPNFEEREYPDLRSYSETGSVVPQPPMTPEELHERIGRDVEEAVAYLGTFEDKHRPFDGSSWEDALALVSETVSKMPQDGFRLLEVVGDDGTDMTRAIISGWARAVDLSPETTAEIVRSIGELDAHLYADDATRLLSDRGDDARAVPWHRLDSARALATSLWESIEAERPEAAEHDWLHESLNTSAGRIADFWVYALAADWRAAGDQWTEIPAGLRLQLERLVDGDSVKHRLAQVIIASNLHFFFAADQTWCERWVLPLLDWSVEERAVAAWSGFLASGRWHDTLLAAGLLEHYLETSRHLHLLEERLAQALCNHLGAVAVQSELGDVRWIWKFTAASPTSARVMWIHAVAWMLRDLPAKAVESLWSRWMRSYWQDRLQSDPVMLTTEEHSAMASWAIHLGPSIAEAVDLLTAHEAGLSNHADFLIDLHDDQVERAPAAVVTIVTHLLRGTEQPFYACNRLKKLVQRVLQASEPPDLDDLIEEAMRLGCINAASWRTQT